MNNTLKDLWNVAFDSLAMRVDNVRDSRDDAVRHAKERQRLDESVKDQYISYGWQKLGTLDDEGKSPTEFLLMIMEGPGDAARIRGTFATDSWAVATATLEVQTWGVAWTALPTTANEAETVLDFARLAMP